MTEDEYRAGRAEAEGEETQRVDRLSAFVENEHGLGGLRSDRHSGPLRASGTSVFDGAPNLTASSRLDLERRDDVAVS
jgi:hypothetical protein